jgi:hypothetical protein
MFFVAFVNLRPNALTHTQTSSGKPYYTYSVATMVGPYGQDENGSKCAA